MATAALATAQINARIEPELKAAGDEGLAAAGFTPTTAIRALWALAAKWRREPEKIEALLEPEPGATEQEERARRLAAIERSSHLVEDYYREHGISAETVANFQLSYDELKELSYKERGWL